MSTIATGVFKKLRYKKQTAQGTIAPGGAATGQELRRVTSTIDLDKAQYQSKEINSSQQRRDNRHGVKSVSGNVSGELSVGTYQEMFEAILRADAVAGGNSGALTVVTAASTGADTGTFTRVGGDWQTTFKVGDVIRWSGWAAPAAGNNATNMIITSLTALVMTCKTLNKKAITAKASGDSVTATVQGRTLAIPLTGHTRDYFTIEHFFSDIVQSEQFIDCVFTGATVKLPPTGMATVDFPVMGLDMSTAAAAYFTSPAAPNTGKLLAAVNGILLVQGVPVGIVTGLEFTINGNYSAPGGVVGSNVDPDIFPGPIDVTGQATVLFDSVTVRDYFINEVEVSIMSVFTTNNTDTADFFAVVMPLAKMGGAKKDDGEKGLTMTMPFVASENVVAAGAPTRATTISMQDSTWVA